MPPSHATWIVCVPELHSFRLPSILYAKNKLGPLASGIIFVVVIPFRFMIAEQTDSPDKVSIVNKSPTTLTSTGGLVTAVPNSPNRSTVLFSKRICEKTFKKLFNIEHRYTSVPVGILMQNKNE